MSSFPTEYFLGVVRVMIGTPMTDVEKVVLLPLVGLAMLLQVILTVLLQRMRRYA